MSFTIVVPHVSRRKYWWPLLRATACDSFLLAQKELWVLSLFHLKGVFLPLAPSLGSLGF